MRWLAVAGVCLALLPWGSGESQARTAELPRQLVAVRAGADLHSPKTVNVRGSSRRMDDPPLPIRAEKLASMLKKQLTRTPLRVVDEAAPAELNAELIIEPSQHWSTDPKHTAPYLFLLVRDHASARVLYCGYRRVGLLYEWAVNNLAKDFAQSTSGAAASGDVAACAKEAMRLPDAGL